MNKKLSNKNSFYFNRNQSPIIHMRRFHNWIKRKLIEIIVTDLKKNNLNNLSLLDLAVGKGGDLQKWYDNQIFTVVGIDKDINSIDETKLRYNQFNNLKQQSLNYQFHVFDLASPSNNSYIDKTLNDNFDPIFDIVSCQFALHYFFKSYTTLNNLITIVSKYLRSGGYFIATTLDGERVSKYVTKNITSCFNIKLNKNENNENQVYGNEVVISSNNYLSNDINDNHYFVKEPSHEYLVNINELIKVCDMHHLSCVDVTHFDQWYQLYENEKNEMTDDEQKFSFLNFTITFKKRTN